MIADQPGLENRTASVDAWFLDPSVLRAARLIYRGYQEVHCEQMQRPMGIVISRGGHRGQLIFSRKPVLLPGECFVPFEQIESQLY